MNNSKGIYKMKKIKLFDPYVTKDEEISILRTLKSHFWASGAGVGNVQKFENSFNKFIGSNQSVAVNSGTAALHLALSLFDLSDKEVILPSLSFVSTAHSVVMNKAKPVFLDVDEDTLCIDPNEIAEKINHKTKALLPVHFGGMPCDLNKISKLAKKHGAELIEDAAHAVGSKYAGKPIGSHGKAVCFSFHPVKNLSMPTGGLIALNSRNSESLSKNLKSKRWCGITNRQRTSYDVDKIGWNYYMNEFSAAIGIVQLKKLNKMSAIRKKIAKRYSEEIKTPLKMPFSKNCSYHLYWIRVKNRNHFMKEMQRKNIETGIHYRPIHTMTYYKNKKSLPVTEKISNEIVSIPIHTNLSENEIGKIIKTINEIS